MNTTIFDPVGPFTYGLIVAMAIEEEGTGKGTKWAFVLDSVSMRLGWICYDDLKQVMT